MKTCIACGMPMNRKEDFAQQDESKDFCKYCTHEDGTMKSFEEKLEDTTNFIIRTQGIAYDVANKSAYAQLRKLPAWK